MAKRVTDPGAIEQRLLELAYTTDLKITASALAYFAPCSTDDADKVLDRLAALGRLHMDVGDHGTVTYELPDRQKVNAPLALQRITPPPSQASPMLAAVFSAFLPGAGHLYTGRIGAAILWFLVVTAGYALVLPGLILHLFNIVSAASSARRVNAATARLQLTTA